MLSRLCLAASSNQGPLQFISAEGPSSFLEEYDVQSEKRRKLWLAFNDAKSSEEEDQILAQIDAVCAYIQSLISRPW